MPGILNSDTESWSPLFGLYRSMEFTLDEKVLAESAGLLLNLFAT